MGSTRSVLLLATTLGCAACPEPAAQRAATPTTTPSAAPTPAPAAASEEDEFGGRVSLELDRAKLLAAGAAPALLARLDASAYRYFRALAIEYSSRVCWEFRDLRWQLPVVAVHGDAHVTQFVVTPDTYGLEDYDRAGFGPAVVDVVRYGSSLHLACRELAWSCDAEEAVSVFLREYRAALAAPPKRVQPALVDRLRRRAPSSLEEWLRWADSLRVPLPAEQERSVRQNWLAFVAQQRLTYPELPAAFFDLVAVGSLHLGIGSALETKYLLRVRGPSDAPNDDVILEARSIKESPPRAGIWRPHHGGSLHTLYFMFLLGPRLPERFGTATLSSDPHMPHFWLQSWEPGYTELALTDVQSQQDLEQLAADAALQLAGHFWTRFPEPLRPAQRFGQLRMFDATAPRARELAKALAAETLVSWQRFRQAR